MRTVYKAWAGTFAGVFLIVAACDVATPDASPSPSSSAAASPPPFARTGTVTGFTNPANLALADGRHIHVPMLNGVDAVNSPDGGCREQAADDTVRAMLSGKTVTLTAPPRTRDARSLVPAGYVEADVTTDSVDYASTFERRYAEAAFDRCTPVVPPVVDTEPAPASSGDTDVYVDHDDTNHRDGAFTGGYCRRKWWC